MLQQKELSFWGGGLFRMPRLLEKVVREINFGACNYLHHEFKTWTCADE